MLVDIKDFCATFTMKNQSVSHCIEVMQLSTTYSNEKLENENTKFMKENFAVVNRAFNVTSIERFHFMSEAAMKQKIQTRG